MERRYLSNLERWMEDPERKPLIVWGPRQCGKTYLITKLFADRYFKDRCVYIDCAKSPSFVSYCERHPDPKDIINYISMDTGVDIDETTLLVFDEAQECLPIVTMMKYFCQDFREIPVIVTGSMVRIRLNRKKRGVRDDGYLFPVGKINELAITPMSFDEYLINKDIRLYHYICGCYAERMPLDDAFHTKAMDALYEYLLIGGMPEAVDIFIRTGDFNASRKALKELYSNYLADMELYQASRESIVRTMAIFRNIFIQLNKPNKDFKPGLIEHGLRNRDLVNPINWLTLARLVNVSRKVKDHVTSPLIEDGSGFRIYPSDMGIFTFQSNINPVTFISDEGRNMLSGIFFESYAAEELSSRGIPLYYWDVGSSELEFILDRNGDIIPMDVKKGKGPMRSLKRFKENNRCGMAVKVSSNNYGYDEENKVLTIPLYELFLFADEHVSSTT